MERASPQRGAMVLAWPILIALALGGVAGWLAWLSDEVLPAVAAVLASTAALSFWRPRSAPWVAIIVGLSIPVFYVVSEAVGRPTPFPAQPGPWASAVALVPAAIGAAFGAGARLVVGSTSR